MSWVYTFTDFNSIEQATITLLTNEGLIFGSGYTNIFDIPNDPQSVGEFITTNDILTKLRDTWLDAERISLVNILNTTTFSSNQLPPNIGESSSSWIYTFTDFNSIEQATITLLTNEGLIFGSGYTNIFDIPNDPQSVGEFITTNDILTKLRDTWLDAERISLVNILNTTTFSSNQLPPNTPTPPRTIELRRLPVPEDLSNSIIFSTNFYSATDLSNGIRSVPTNLFDSSGNTDISFNQAKQFWLDEISNNTFSDPSNEGITIITIQFTSNYSNTHEKPGAHMLEFYNWDLSANSNYSLNLNNNSRMFKAYENTKLISDMSFIVGIPNINQDISLQKIPLAIKEGPNSENTFTDMCDNNFNNYMIVLGKPILVNISELYSYNLRNLKSDNLCNWRSNTEGGSSSNNIWINNTNYYSDDISYNILNPPLILIPDVSYTIHNSNNIDVSFNNDINIPFNGSRVYTVSDITHV